MGVMPAQTPSGWRIDHESMPRPTCSLNSPLMRCGMPHANSTTSRPRVTSPRASESTLPCSEVMSAASSSACFSMRLRNSNITRARARGGVAAHSGNAFDAAFTAASTSAASAHTNFARELTGGGIEDLAEVVVVSVNLRAADEMRDGFHASVFARQMAARKPVLDSAPRGPSIPPGEYMEADAVPGVVNADEEHQQRRCADSEQRLARVRLSEDGGERQDAHTRAAAAPHETASPRTPACRPSAAASGAPRSAHI